MRKTTVMVCGSVKAWGKSKIAKADRAVQHACQRLKAKKIIVAEDSTTAGVATRVGATLEIPVEAINFTRGCRTAVPAVRERWLREMMTEAVALVLLSDERNEHTKKLFKMAKKLVKGVILVQL